jgi:hypothetical protein
MSAFAFGSPGLALAAGAAVAVRPALVLQLEVQAQPPACPKGRPGSGGGHGGAAVAECKKCEEVQCKKKESKIQGDSPPALAEMAADTTPDV